MDGQPQRLISKIQYRNFEKGEFIDSRERTHEQTIALIEQFPWESQRDHLTISLTNPSVTIEGLGGDFLKLALYYNGKFVLHYLGKDRHLYTLSMARYQEAYPYIQSFFAAYLPATGNVLTPFETHDLRQETTWLSHPLQHFADGNFTYKTSWARLFFTSSPMLFFAPILFLLIVVSLSRPMPTHPALFFSLLILPLIASIVFSALLINHWRFTRGQALRLTRGQDLFYYGPAEQPAAFDKKNILEIVTHGRRGRGGSYRGILFRMEINFKDGTSVNLSTLLLDQVEFVAKFPGYPLRDQKEWLPFIPPSASAPS